MTGRGPFDPRLRRRQIEVLYEQLPVSIATNVAASVLFGVIAWPVAGSAILLIWVALTLALSASRAVLYREFRRAAESTERQTDWLRPLIATMVLSGLLWSAGLIITAPAPVNPEYHLFSILWIVGLSAGSMGAYSVLPPAYLAFSVPMIAPYVAYLTLTGQRADLYGALALVLFFAFLWFCAKRLNQAILESVRLKFENDDLIDDLNREKAVIQSLNDDLEGRIEKRTADLTSANAKLTSEIREREKAESNLRVSERRYRALYHQTPSMFFTLDRLGKVLRVNEFGARKLGYQPAELEGHPFPVSEERTDDPDLVSELHKALQNPGVAQRWECGVRRRDGERLWVSASAQAANGALDEEAILLVCEDVTKARELASTLAYHAAHDALTGLVNRREFESRLAAAVQGARKGNEEHALLYMDLDLFKVVNDTCGHAAGDELLRELASALSAEVGRSDTLARLGGDEFGALLMNCRLENAATVAERLRATAEAMRFTWGERKLRIGLSIGVVPVDEQADTSTQLLQRADTACYVSKEHGRNRVHIYDLADEELSAHSVQARWVARINEALDEDRLRLSFQSIQPINGPSDCGSYEILVRMVDDDGATISAGEFLPAAERYGLTPKIDRWVVKATLDWLADRPQELDSIAFCSINLSGLSLADDGFHDFVVEQLQRSRIAGEKLVFEVTETAAISQLGAATRFLEALKSHGCRFALDDFGTGLSSFAYLKTLPVDFLKIDGVFVRDIAHDPVDLAMVKSINDMGHVLGIGTIAECVEDQATLDRLRDIGVDHAQGFFIDLPRALDRAPETGHSPEDIR